MSNYLKGIAIISYRVFAQMTRASEEKITIYCLGKIDFIHLCTSRRISSWRDNHYGFFYVSKSRRTVHPAVQLKHPCFSIEYLTDS